MCYVAMSSYSHCHLRIKNACWSNICSLNIHFTNTCMQFPLINHPFTTISLTKLHFHSTKLDALHMICQIKPNTIFKTYSIHQFTILYYASLYHVLKHWDVKLWPQCGPLWIVKMYIEAAFDHGTHIECCY